MLSRLPVLSVLIFVSMGCFGEGFVVAEPLRNANDERVSITTLQVNNRITINVQVNARVPERIETQQQYRNTLASVTIPSTEEGKLLYQTILVIGRDQRLFHINTNANGELTALRNF